MFKVALCQRRCLVPAEAFYEWEARPDGKQPYAIARRDRTPVTSAGVWEWWKAPDETLLRSFAILTTSANATMRQSHERMPVILEPDAWAVWLGQDDNTAMKLMLRQGMMCCISGRCRGRSTACGTMAPELLERGYDQMHRRLVTRPRGRTRFDAGSDERDFKQPMFIGVG